MKNIFKTLLFVVGILWCFNEAKSQSIYSVHNNTKCVIQITIECYDAACQLSYSGPVLYEIAPNSQLNFNDCFGYGYPDNLLLRIDWEDPSCQTGGVLMGLPGNTCSVPTANTLPLCLNCTAGGSATIYISGFDIFVDP